MIGINSIRFLLGVLCYALSTLCLSDTLLIGLSCCRILYYSMYCMPSRKFSCIKKISINENALCFYHDVVNCYVYYFLFYVNTRNYLNTHSIRLAYGIPNSQNNRHSTSFLSMTERCLKGPTVEATQRQP